MAGESNRWVASIFLHSSFMHLISNVLTFLLLSNHLETHYGVWRIFTVWLLSGASAGGAPSSFRVPLPPQCTAARLASSPRRALCSHARAPTSASPAPLRAMAGLAGNFCSAAFEESCVIVVGSSGSVFGFIGFYIADILLNFETLPRPALQLATMLASIGLSIGLQARARARGADRAGVCGTRLRFVLLSCPSHRRAVLPSALSTARCCRAAARARKLGASRVMGCEH